MKYTCIPAHELTSEQVAAWDRIQSANAALDSPFLRPEFTAAVAAVRQDIEVAVIEDGGQIVGFFPFQRAKWNVGKPVGWKLCDVQGIVVPSGVSCDAAQMVRACRLSAWDYSGVPAELPHFQKFHERLEENAFMDVSQGFEAYCATRREAGSSRIQDVSKKRRKAQREVGPVRFEPRTEDPQAWPALLRWKSEQYRRTRAVNVLAFRWTVGLLERIQAERNPAFGGILSALYFGDCLAAVELGLRSSGVDHSWFTAFNPSFSRYSPGSIMLVELVQAAAAIGISRIDLGKIRGMEYKTSFMSATRTLACGSIVRRPLRRLMRQSWIRTREWVKASRLRTPASHVATWLRPIRGMSAFR